MHLALLTLTLSLGAEAGRSIDLRWPAGTPGAPGAEAADKPSLTVYLPRGGRSNGTGVIVHQTGELDHWIV